MTVIEFKKHKEDNEPHNRGLARCLDCKHEWEAIAHCDVVWLECPKCSLEKGHFIGPHTLPEGSMKWVCNCGNDLFQITREGCFCQNCGELAVFPK